MADNFKRDCHAKIEYQKELFGRACYRLFTELSSYKVPEGGGDRSAGGGGGVGFAHHEELRKRAERPKTYT